MSWLLDSSLFWFTTYGVGCICGMAAALAMVKATRCENCCMHAEDSPPET